MPTKISQTLSRMHLLMKVKILKKLLLTTRKLLQLVQTADSLVPLKATILKSIPIPASFVVFLMQLSTKLTISSRPLIWTRKRIRIQIL